MTNELVELKKVFAEEAVAICFRSRNLISLTPESEVYNSSTETMQTDFLRLLHTIKGNSGFFELDLLESFSSRVEDLVISKPQFAFSQELKKCFLEIIELIRFYCSDLSEISLFPSEEADKLVNELSDCLTISNQVENSVSVTVLAEELSLLINLKADALVFGHSGKNIVVILDEEKIKQLDYVEKKQARGWK